MNGMLESRTKTPAGQLERTLGALAAGALLLLALRLGGRPAAVEHRGAARGLPAARPSSPSEVARREAGRSWMRAVRQVKQELERLEEWDQAAPTATHREEWRRRLMAADDCGDLQRARGAAVAAAALARSPDEAYQATAVLVGIECDLGEREAATQHARALVRLRPGSAEALAILRHAARCGQPMPTSPPAEVALKGTFDETQQALRSRWQGHP